MRVAKNWLRASARVAGVGLLMLAGCVATMAQGGKPEKLECESLVTPLGMDAEKPVLSWQLRDTRDGAKQTAYDVQVASSAANLAAGKADVWDSGKVESSDSIGVVVWRAGDAGEQTIFLARVGVGSRREGVSSERCELVGDGVVAARELEGEVDWV